MEQVAHRVNYAKEIHNSKKLSDLIQRELDEKTRAGQIGDYLIKNQDRFFNSLVVAVYGGDPDWHEFHTLRAVANDIDVEELPYSVRYGVGYLSFSGEEKLFAVDGQHRLAGIRNALKTNAELKQEELSIIVVAHHTDERGMRRTRKLFTTLNKTAQPVSKSEIIALDEADAMAITARNLVEYDPRFSDVRIDIMRKQANLPRGDSIHFTTLINLYDVLEILFVKAKKGAKGAELKRFRPTDEELTAYQGVAKEYFSLLADRFSSVKRCLNAADPEVVIKKYRHSRGGHILFRPVGLLIFTDVVATLMRVEGKSLKASVRALKSLPTLLASYPYDGVLWDKATKTINVGRRALARDLLLHQLGLIKDARRANKLQARYATVRGGSAEEYPIHRRR